MKIKNFSLPFLGFLQATGFLIYILPISLIMTNGNKIFGPTPIFLGPIAFLLLFIVSAVISGLLILGRAGYLFWEKRYKEAFTLVGWTLAFCILYLVSIFTLLFLSK